MRYQIISLFGHIGPTQKNTHINIGTRKKNQIICSREYVILNWDHAVHINSTIISISFLSKFGIDHCCSLILSSDDNKAAWPLSSSVRSFFSTSNLSAYLRFIDMGELQKWALRANKLIKRFSLDIQVAKNVLNLSTSWYLIWLVCTINGRRYRWVLYGKWKILLTALFHAVHINSKLELTLYPQATGQWRIRRFNCILAAEGPLRR